MALYIFMVKVSRNSSLACLSWKTAPSKKQSKEKKSMITQIWEVRDEIEAYTQAQVNGISTRKNLTLSKMV